MAIEGSRPVRTRFAPSPSGHLHVGGARTALFCWAYARGRGGKFVLRIEDTDRKRSSEAAAAAFMEDLAWLAIDWDEGPRFQECGGGEAGPYQQSQRLAIYQEHADRLIAEGKAYRAFETQQELAEARVKAAKKGYRYDRAALRLDDATIKRYLDEKRPHVVRFRLPDAGPITFNDVVRGEVTVPAEELDDFVIVKADGFPTYHFAVVVDDETMGVSHVIRGQEHLYNTARHVLLQEALGFARPLFAHVSLIFNADGSKMSKRERDRVLRRAIKAQGIQEPPAGAGVDGAEWSRWLADKDLQLEPQVARRLAERLEIALPEIDVEDFRSAGYLPEVLVNYLALLGWSPATGQEKFDRAFLAEHFDLDRLVKSNARFDRKKLLAFNLDALQALAPEAFARRLREHAARYHPEFLERLDERFDHFATCNLERSKTLEDPFRDGRFFVIDDDEVVYERSKAVRKALGGDPAGTAHLEALAPRLEGLAEWTVGALEQAITTYAATHAGGKLGRVAQPLRIAVSGRPVSPAIFDTLFILGQQSVVRRIERCLAVLGAEKGVS